MKTDDLNEIFSGEKEIQPSPSFTGIVMSRVESEAAQPRPIPFPWIPLSAITLLIILAIWAFPEAGRAMNALSYSAGKWLVSPPEVALGNVILPAAGSILGTLALIWFSLRLVGAGR